MKWVVWGAVFLLSGCASLSYRPLEGVEGAPVPLGITEAPRSVALGPYRLTQVKMSVNSSDLPFQEDGGTYTVESSADYSFQNPGTLGQAILMRTADVTVGPGGQNLTTVSVTTVSIGLGEARTETKVRRSLGTDEFLEWKAPHRVVVSFDFRALADGKPTTLWTQPAGLKIVKDGAAPVFVSLLPPYSVFGVADPVALDPETALAILVGFEAVVRNLDPGPQTLPSRSN
jgi:hypothetical protein